MAGLALAIRVCTVLSSADGSLVLKFALVALRHFTLMPYSPEMYSLRHQQG